MAGDIPSVGLGTPWGAWYAKPGSVMAAKQQEKREEERYAKERDDKFALHYYNEMRQMAKFGNEKMFASDKAELETQSALPLSKMIQAIRDGQGIEGASVYERDLQSVLEKKRAASSHFADVNSTLESLEELEYVDKVGLGKIAMDYQQLGVQGRTMAFGEYVKSRASEAVDGTKMVENYAIKMFTQLAPTVKNMGNNLMSITETKASDIYELNENRTSIKLNEDGLPVLKSPEALYEKMIEDSPLAFEVFQGELRKLREEKPEATMNDVMNMYSARLRPEARQEEKLRQVTKRSQPTRQPEESAYKTRQNEKYDKIYNAINGLVSGDERSLIIYKEDLDKSKYDVKLEDGKINVYKKVKATVGGLGTKESEELIESFDATQIEDASAANEFKLKLAQYLDIPEPIRGVTEFINSKIQQQIDIGL